MNETVTLRGGPMDKQTAQVLVSDCEVQLKDKAGVRHSYGRAPLPDLEDGTPNPGRLAGDMRYCGIVR